MKSQWLKRFSFLLEIYFLRNEGKQINIDELINHILTLRYYSNISFLKDLIWYDIFTAEVSKTLKSNNNNANFKFRAKYGE